MGSRWTLWDLESKLWVWADTSCLVIGPWECVFPSAPETDKQVLKCSMVHTSLFQMPAFSVFGVASNYAAFLACPHQNGLVLFNLLGSNRDLNTSSFERALNWSVYSFRRAAKRTTLRQKFSGSGQSISCGPWDVEGSEVWAPVL